MTFRINEDILEKLRQESERNGVSLNTFANQIFKQFLEWDMFESRGGMVSLAKPVIVELLRKMSHDEIVEIAKRFGKNAVRDIATFVKGGIDLNSFLSWYESRMKASSVEVNHTIKHGEHNYIMKQDIGPNWSLYHKTILELIFQDVFDKKITVNFTETMISFKLSE